jgi:hypothetical protein
MGRKKVDPSVNRSQVFGVPGIVGQKTDISRALKVGRSQIARANQAAMEMGCGAPFQADGNWVGTRAEKKKYMQELNHRRADQGEPRYVNNDGGYGDET